MADTKMLYDFETALRALINSQSDVMVLVQKWGEMLDSDPHDVTFMLKGADGTAVSYAIPNIQKVIDTLNTRTLPPNPVFDSVSLRDADGAARLTPGSIKFEGSGSAVGASYDAYGVEGKVWLISETTTVTHWPIPRYWRLRDQAAITVTISPNIEEGDFRATDFFVFVPGGSSITLLFHSYGASQKMELNADSGKSVWHIVMHASRNQYGLHTEARAVKMED